MQRDNATRPGGDINPVPWWRNNPIAGVPPVDETAVAEHLSRLNDCQINITTANDGRGIGGVQRQSVQRAVILEEPGAQ